MGTSRAFNRAQVLLSDPRRGLRALQRRTRQSVQAARSAWSRPPAVTARPDGAPWYQGLTDAEFVEEAYQRIFGRAPDVVGLQTYVGKLSEWSREDVLNVLGASPEAEQGPGPRLAMEAFHSGRVIWTSSLPPATRILDLGGTSLDDERGSLLMLGYPYRFEQLDIIDLPPEERHELYNLPEWRALETDNGPVRYVYRSMCDLADYPDETFDLVVSGQSFEHIPESAGRQLLHDVHRVLKPGGALALDTPNRLMTAIEVQHDERMFINPDHKIEYTNEQMLKLFDDAGFVVERAHGIGLMPLTAATGEFVFEDLIEHPRVYADIDRCYSLAYLVRRPAVGQY